jgi:hypothetical protein
MLDCIVRSASPVPNTAPDENTLELGGYLNGFTQFADFGG